MNLFSEEIENALCKAFLYYNANLPWKTKYEVIFSNEVSDVLFEFFNTSSYYDPDSSYEEDVIAFIKWLREILGDEVSRYDK